MVPMRFLMCGEHWAMVPDAVKRRVWRHYIPGQEHGSREPTDEYWAALSDAIKAVAQMESPDGSADPQK